MTGATIRAALNARLSKTEAADAIDTEIDAALEKIAEFADWPDLHKTDTSTLTFAATNKSKALPDDFKRLDRLYVADDRTLASMLPDTLRAYQELESAATGEPTHYAIIGGKCCLYPIPEAETVVYLDYWHDPATVTDETAALVLGDEFKEAVILWTIVAYLQSNGLNAHPKLKENVGLFDREIALLLDRRDSKPVITKPYTYC